MKQVDRACDLHFQSGDVPVCVYLACCVMAADSQNIHSILSNIQTCRVSDDPISVVGNFCGLLKPFHLFKKLKIIGQAESPPARRTACLPSHVQNAESVLIPPQATPSERFF